MLVPLVNWPQTKVIDLFAGSGALGFEALSRGANDVLFVENNRKHCGIIQENIDTFDPQIESQKQNLEVQQNKAQRVIEKQILTEDQYVVFIDPPYASKEYEAILQLLSSSTSIQSGSLMVVESAKSRKLIYPENFELLKHREYGTVKLDILIKTND